MADTQTIVSGATVSCDDCDNPAVYLHYGPLVPLGETGKFCSACMHKRSEYLNKHGEAKPIKEKAK